MNKSLPERVLQVAFKANPERPIALSSEDIYWKLDDPNLEIPRIKEVLEALVAKGDMHKDLGKYILDRFTFFDLKKLNNIPPKDTEEAPKKPTRKKVSQSKKKPPQPAPKEHLEKQSLPSSKPEEKPKEIIPETGIPVIVPEASHAFVSPRAALNIKPLSWMLFGLTGVQFIVLAYFTFERLNSPTVGETIQGGNSSLLLLVLWLALTTTIGSLLFLRKLTSHIQSMEASS